MSKNLTRKGLALGVGVALATTGLATPAYAVDAITTTLSSGTSYNSLTGYSNELLLTTNISADYATPDETLKYRVINSGAAHIDVLAGTNSASLVRPDNTDGELNEYGLNVDLADSETSVQTGVQTNDNDFVVDLVAGSFSPVGNYTANNYLSVAVQDATTTNYVVTVQAWMDTDDDNTIDSTEYAASVQTLNFYDETAVTAVTTVLAPVVGASNVKAEITTTPELNGEQLGTDAINAKFTTQGNDNAIFASASRSSANVAGSTTYSGTTKKWTSTAQLYGAANATPWSGSALSTVSLIGFTYTTDNGSGATTTEKHFKNGSTAHGIVVGAFATVGTTTTSTGGAGTALADAATATATKVETVSASEVKFTGFTGLTGVATAGAKTIDAGTLTYATKPAAQATVVAGTYSADAYIGTATKLSTASAGVATATAAAVDTEIVGTANFTGAENSDDSNDSTIYVKKSYTGTIPVSVEVTKSNGAAVAAGVSVQVTANSFTGVVYINSTKVEAGTVVNLTTDAAGKASFTVNATSGLTTDALNITVSSEGLTTTAASGLAFDWADSTYALVDLLDEKPELERTITTGGSQAFKLALVDQFGTKLTSADYRLEVVSTGRTASTVTYSLASGTADVIIADQGIVGGTNPISVTVDVEKLVSGAWSDTDGLTDTNSSSLTLKREWNSTSADNTHKVNVIAAQTDAVALNANSESLGGTTAVTSGTISTDALVAVDNRLTTVDFTTSPTTQVVVSGIVRNATTLAARKGAEVTVSGPAGVFFNVGDVWATGSITFYAESDGGFAVNVHSNKAAKDLVITAASGGSSKEVKVTFTGGVAAQTGASLSIVAPEKIKSGSTLKWSVAVLDKFGNKVDSDQSSANAAGAATVDATDATFKIEYVGLGLAVGTLPSAVLESSVDGNDFTYLLGANDSGLVTIKVSYDQNGDKDFLDPKDLVVTKTVLVGVSATVSAAKKAASVTVKNAEGLTVKVVSGSKSVTKTATSESYKLSLTKLTAGKKTVKVYVNDVLVTSKSVTVKK